MIRTGYKIARLPLYTSLFVPPPYCKVYPIGEIVTAASQTLGLMVFSPLAAANDFYNYSSRWSGGLWTILEIEYDTNDVIIADYVSLYFELDSLTEFYRDLNQEVSTSWCAKLVPPLGTVCCSKLKVIREIKPPLTKK